MILRGVPLNNPDFPVAIRTRLKGKRGLVVFEVEAPKAILPLVESAVYFILGLGQTLHQELRHSVRAQNVEQIRKENRKKREKIFSVYMRFRIKRNLSHREALKALVDDEHFKGSKWTTKDFASILPRERNIRAEVKRLRKSTEGLREAKKLKRQNFMIKSRGQNRAQSKQ